MATSKSKSKKDFTPDIRPQGTTSILDECVLMQTLINRFAHLNITESAIRLHLQNHRDELVAIGAARRIGKSWVFHPGQYGWWLYNKSVASKDYFDGDYKAEDEAVA